jgi:hypothetical protein
MWNGLSRLCRAARSLNVVPPRASGRRLMLRRQDSSPRTSVLAGLALLVVQTVSALSDPQLPTDSANDSVQKLQMALHAKAKA